MSQSSQSITRQCCLTRQREAPEKLLRFVAAPSGEIVPDFARKLQGRGAWILPQREILLQAVKDKRLTRALTQKYKTQPYINANSPIDFADQIHNTLKARALKTLGLAQRASLVIAGETKVRAELNTYKNKNQAGVSQAGVSQAGVSQAGVSQSGVSQSGVSQNNDKSAILLLQASDGADNICRQIANLAIHNVNNEEFQVLKPFTAHELAAAIGREHHVHVLLKSAPLTRKLKDELLTLQSLAPSKNTERQ
ncbi:MAG: DUF448 domain-containing protein [Alphaproteobacteria bacterium]